MDKLKKEILEEFEKEFVKDNGEYIEPSFIDPVGSVGPIKAFLIQTIDRVRVERDEEVEEIPVMKGSNEALDNITIRKE